MIECETRAPRRLSGDGDAQGNLNLGPPGGSEVEVVTRGSPASYWTGVDLCRAVLHISLCDAKQQVTTSHPGPKRGFHAVLIPRESIVSFFLQPPRTLARPPREGLKSAVLSPDRPCGRDNLPRWDWPPAHRLQLSLHSIELPHNSGMFRRNYAGLAPGGQEPALELGGRSSVACTLRSRRDVALPSRGERGPDRGSERLAGQHVTRACRDCPQVLGT